MKHYPALVISFTTGILLMVGYIFFLLFGPYHTPVLSNITPTDPVTAGHLARYTAQECKATNQEAEVSRTLVSNQPDGLEVIVGLDSAVIRRISCSNIMLIPLSTPTGDYTLVISAKVQVNPIRTVIREYRSVKFHVNNPNPDAIIPSTISMGEVGKFIVAPERSPVIEPTTQPDAEPAPSPAPRGKITKGVTDFVSNTTKKASKFVEDLFQ